MPTVERSRADELLAAETVAAWQEYLVDTGQAPDVVYDEVELWAWWRLQHRLSKVEQRRGVLTASAA